MTEDRDALVEELRAIKPTLPEFGFDTFVHVPEGLRDRVVAALSILPPTTSAGDGELVEHISGGGPHEWGYRDITDGTFIEDDWPFKAAEALPRLTDLLARQHAAMGDVMMLRRLSSSPNQREMACTAIAVWREVEAFLAVASRSLALVYRQRPIGARPNKRVGRMMEREPMANEQALAVHQRTTPQRDALEAAYARLHKFAVEWKVMERRSGYGGTVYELHAGDPRHAVCDINDIIKLLEVAP